MIGKDDFSIEGETYYKSDALWIKNDLSLMVKKGEKESISIDFVLDKLKTYKNGDVVGKAKIKLKDQVVREENIYVEKKEEKKSKTSLWQKILGWLKHD